MKTLQFILIGCLIFIGSVCLTFGAEKKAQLIFSEMSVVPGQKVKIPVILDHVPNMAGIKLALKFDKDLLTYVKSEKTKSTASLMHIVNDKHPGKLVIVMAGARGVPVNNQSIMNLYFEINKVIPKPVDTKFKVTELQLMSDSLKELPYEYQLHPIHIMASKKSKTGTQKDTKKTIVSEPEPITPQKKNNSQKSEPKKQK
ncbi:MAG: cellulosome anchoring protein [Candidatus Magnetoglobus multicellularis str. Araruama]|uniref:Cellulosome anchoring protein n=1 Tax=Candidatus Magnetoglobus multicellularis str. Araruama TaxID=890399 RepID=A0A1V1PID2_9BACT|nr:MAG: cellulosome anchoring protein [Candidatus Magnetoglobus multicellularis str. Araruama]